MKNIYLAATMLAACLGQAADVPADRPIHPKAFAMISCWLSDTREPVVTQFSLDAIHSNRNEYPYDQVKIEGDWVVYVDGRERIAYQLKEVDAEIQEAHVYANGGGSLTTQTIITFCLIPKTITRNGRKATIRVVDVIGIATGGQAKPIGDEK